MQELIEKIVAEAGISAEQAGKALQTVAEFVKSKVPPTFSGMIDSILSGQQFEMKEESLQDKAADFAGAAKDKLEDLAGDAKDKLSDAAEKAEELAKDTLGKLKGMFGGDK
jgi:uncharacterized protein YjbJ (UPF0337 family)